MKKIGAIIIQETLHMIVLNAETWSRLKQLFWELIIMTAKKSYFPNYWRNDVNLSWTIAVMEFAESGISPLINNNSYKQSAYLHLGVLKYNAEKFFKKSNCWDTSKYGARKKNKEEQKEMNIEIKEKILMYLWNWRWVWS